MGLTETLCQCDSSKQRSVRHKDVAPLPGGGAQLSSAPFFIKKQALLQQSQAEDL